MPLPYQYRDYPLALFMAVVFVVSGIYSLTTDGYQSVRISLTEVCAAPESCPVVTSLSALSAARDVRHHDLGGGRGVVTLRARRSLSADQIWQIVENASCRPTQMVVDNREFVSESIR